MTHNPEDDGFEFIPDGNGPVTTDLKRLFELTQSLNEGVAEPRSSDSLSLGNISEQDILDAEQKSGINSSESCCTKFREALTKGVTYIQKTWQERAKDENQSHTKSL